MKVGTCSFGNIIYSFEENHLETNFDCKNVVSLKKTWKNYFYEWLKYMVYSNTIIQLNLEWWILVWRIFKDQYGI